MPREVERPTWEVTGPASRVDERETLFARERLLPGSPEEKAFHREHPELEEVDRKLAGFIREMSGPGGKRVPRRAVAFYQATFDPTAALALPDVVDGPVAEEKVEMDPAAATARLKGLARFLGADRVRVGPLNQAFVYSHKGCPPFFPDHRPNPPFFAGPPGGMKDLRWGDPVELPHAFAVSMAFAQDLDMIRSSPSPESDLEVGRVYARAALAAVHLARFIRSLGYSARAHHLRSSAVMLVPVAAEAGLGEPARSGYLLAPGLGLNFRISCVTTDMPLEPDKPIDMGVQDFCSKCLKCARACPAGVIPRGEKVVERGVRKWVIEREKCLLFWGRIGSACAICQAACPWSKPPTPFHRFVGWTAEHIPFSRPFLVWADDLVYGKRPKPGRLPPWAGPFPGEGPASPP